MKKTGTIITLFFVAVLAIGGLIFSQLSYKICWRCDAEGFFNRGMEYSCNEKESYRRTGLGFIDNAAGQGYLKAELTLAELYSDNLPEDYVRSDSEQIICLQQEVKPDQTTGVSYFESVLGAVEQGKEADPVTLANLGLLYLKGVVPAENPVVKATSLYERAAAAGSFPAMRTLGKLANDRGDYPTAMQWFVEAAKDPADGFSPLMVGDYFFYGKGVVIDYQKAEEWYNKALTRAGKSEKDGESESLQLGNMALARLDLVQRKLAGVDGRKQQVAISYHIDGSIHHFVIFAAEKDNPEESIGEVIRDGDTITAVMNTNLEGTAELPESGQQSFSSMNEGLFWILNTFAESTHDDAANLIFNFVLTKS